MNVRVLILVLAFAAAWSYVQAQDPPPAEESSLSTRYSLAVIDDATFYNGMPPSQPAILNQVLVEPTFDIRYRNRYTFSTSVIGLSTTYTDTASTLRVKETYAGLSAGDFDFTLGRKMVRWGTGYAFTAAGVLDPPRDPTNPTDRLNVNQGRDMIKADYVKGPHAFTLAWSSAALAPARSTMRDTTAFRYNVLVRGFDTSFIAGNDRGGDSFGGITFTRVLGQAWELHGEAVWREQAAALIGAKCTLHSGVTFIGEFYTPPNTSFFRDMSVSPLAGRQHYVFFNSGKTRLRQLPGWKEWDVSGSIVANLDDHSRVGIFDVSRWFGNHFSSYVHLEIPTGSKSSDFGVAPYDTATSAGVRFHL
ncbi:hypothetical protein P8935_02195 [Telmatobacter sp. DSM 110680]|uniref:Uncharacterized protein n=1 Tax=Telmatobacter sp. DSM 110680 TaxID=3036704 RepID=A0AAU7DN32_9BACT